MKHIQKHLNTTKSNYLKSLYSNLAGYLYAIEKDFNNSIEYFLNSIQYNSNNYSAYNNLGQAYLDKYAKSNYKNIIYLEKSINIYKQINLIELYKIYAIRDPEALYIIDIYNQFTEKYNQLNMENILTFISNKPIWEKVKIIDALWKIHINYSPNFSPFLDDFKTIVTKKEGDCDTYTRFVSEILQQSRPEANIEFNYIRIQKHGFLIIHDKTSNYYYKLDVGEYPVKNKNILNILGNINQYYILEYDTDFYIINIKPFINID